MNNADIEKKERDIAEITVSIVSLIIVISLIVYMVFDRFTSGNQPPLIEIKPQLKAVKMKNNHYYMPVEIVNSGDKTAQDLWILVNANEETVVSNINFLPGNGIKKQTLIFNRNPQNTKITSTASFNTN